MSEYKPSLAEIDEAMRFLTERSLVKEGLAGRESARKMVDRWLCDIRSHAWSEGYVRGCDDQAEETRTGEMQVTINPYGYADGIIRGTIRGVG